MEKIMTPKQPNSINSTNSDKTNNIAPSERTENFALANGQINLLKALTKFKPVDVIAEITKYNQRSRGADGCPKDAPLGTTLRELVYYLGGEIPSENSFKAIQIGGAFGSFIPAEYTDKPIDPETLTSLGAISGTESIIVLDSDTCVVNLVKIFLQYSCNESCGKCTPCRIGNKRMLEIITKITEGYGTMEDLKELETLASHIKSTSLCGLGQNSPNPVLSSLRYFKEEYIAHIKNKCCPAGVCKALIKYDITEKCVGCGLCKRNCPVQCINGEIRTKHKIDETECIHCGLCQSLCPVKAIIKK